MSDTFYFVALINKCTALTVIDLAHCVDYERDDWCIVDDVNFDNPQEAIAHAKRLAALNDLEYSRFDSRYDSSLSEPKGLLKYY